MENSVSASLFFFGNISLIIGSVLAYLTVTTQKYYLFCNVSDEIEIYHKDLTHYFRFRFEFLKEAINWNRKINASKANLLQIAQFLAILGLVLLALSLGVAAYDGS